MDREIQDVYTLVVQVRDNPTAKYSQQLSDSMVIKIKILDINDNSPQCEKEAYEIETVQNVDVNTTLLQIKAFDADNGENARITYSLMSANFSRKPGKIYE